MKVISVNIGAKNIVNWKGKRVQTGIFKKPVNQIVLNLNYVKNDIVVDTNHHAGLDKACYIYSYQSYGYWKKLYPKLSLDFGMFGENVTIDKLDESKIFIGDIYKLGDATVQVTQPRQPCFKLGIRFGNQKIVKQFINAPFPGVYLKVIEKGKVAPNDKFQLIERQHETLSIIEVWNLIYKQNVTSDEINFALSLPYLADACKKSLAKKHT
ncbi:MAG TPA: MOSC domain-containing protein [Crocinitomix sp.]|nr:MOSC domain-containing protein [Crocinitomix sp.]